MEEGQKVVVLGSVSVYERDGKYQIYAKEIILEGAGLLYQRFEQLKIELEEMGLLILCIRNLFQDMLQELEYVQHRQVRQYKILLI